ncbi:MAG: glucuronate isomerase, partial [Clostridia bacterium]|nr:glucuronate isomerase [Clostridia bacterium]
MIAKTIISEDFLLRTKTGRRLYETYAENEPIIDYHCHLDPKRIADNSGFSSIADLFLGGDHYKWRAMRSFGVAEELITGDGDPRDKFREYAKTVSYAIGNPLYHWTALELKRYFDVDVALNGSTADAIFDATLPLFKKEEYTPRGFISRSNVEVICTTDDPASSLEYHESIEKSGFGTKVVPAFRPDRCVNVRKSGFREYISGLGAGDYDGLKRILSGSMDRFEAHGCRLADHGLDFIPEKTKVSPAAAFEKAMAGG